MGNGAAAAFDIRRMNPGWFAGLLLKIFLEQPQWWMRPLRRFLPIARIPFLGWAVVTRYDDVQEVLLHNRAFPVPFEKNMRALTGGQNFVLGMAEDAEYGDAYKELASAFRRADVPQLANDCTRITEEILARGQRLDVVKNLITRVPTRICEEYFGVAIPDRTLFGKWTIAMSGFLFSPPSDKPSDSAQLALEAAEPFRALLDASIKRARDSNAPDSIARRLVVAGVPDERIHAHLFGMIMGFVPTNTMAAGNLLETLLERPAFMRRTQAALEDPDPDLFRRCLLEAMRFRPINPGPFRLCSEDYTIAAGAWRGKTIAPGTNLLVSTQSAMFDERAVTRPGDFDPDRPAEQRILFGFGQHWCIGTYIAQAQIVATFRALLSRPNLRRAKGAEGRMKRYSLFPAHLVMEYDR